MLISKLPNMSHIKYARKFIPVSLLVKTQPLNTIMGLIILSFYLKKARQPLKPKFQACLKEHDS